MNIYKFLLGLVLVFFASATIGLWAVAAGTVWYELIAVIVIFYIGAFLVART